jgi:hypothetical protein
LECLAGSRLGLPGAARWSGDFAIAQIWAPARGEGRGSAAGPGLVIPSESGASRSYRRTAFNLASDDTGAAMTLIDTIGTTGAVLTTLCWPACRRW